MKVLELFAGTRSIGKAFEAHGHKVFSVEWDKKFEKIDLYADVLTLTAEQIIEKFGRPDVIWASPDCTTYSVAAISTHRRKELNGNLTPMTDYAKFCDKVKPILAAHGIKYTELHPQNPFLYDMLERPVESKQKGKHNGYGWCGGVCRRGTKQKQVEIDKYLRGLDVQRHYIGIAADEPERLDRLQYPKCAPLADAEMTEADCLRYCAEMGFVWDENGVDLYKILDRVSCWCCANKNRKELKNMYLYLPEYWERLKDLQRQIDRPMKKFCNKRHGNYGNVFDMERVFKEE